MQQKNIEKSVIGKPAFIYLNRQRRYWEILQSYNIKAIKKYMKMSSAKTK